MRTWRVGSMSMGASLLFLGIFLLLSQLLKWDSAYVLAGWWPVLLIVLGAEILVYLFLSKQEKPILKYDFLSIIFVAVIGTVGIGFTVVQATGLMGQMQSFFDSEVKTADLPSYSHQVGDDVKRIVVDSSHYPITVETVTDKEVSVFGTYRSSFTGGKPSLSNPEDYLMTTQKGDTLYITLKSLPDSNGWMQSGRELEATLVIPGSKSLEISSDYNEVTLKPRTISSSWEVSSSARVNLVLVSSEDLTINAENVGDIQGEEVKWQYTEQTAVSDTDVNNEGIPNKSATLKLGSGQHPITISHSDQVNVSIKN
ncbi:LiaF transmembrane domain-containing protein [Rossellomorea sp. NRS-1567]|uniref:LiaF transmembrane domain-containing protein n=1 Tax=Rossellomorea sp. NRS-1567 TaxID=3233901 RepID=UPI003D2E0335